MSILTAQLLEQFEQLTANDPREFSRAILHRGAHLDDDAPSTTN